VDVYLPNIKYSYDEAAFKYSGIENYVEVNCAALKERKRSVGSLKVDNCGVARRGLIIR
jgi:putative pyruvate formate lyase activating enzyme